MMKAVLRIGQVKYFNWYLSSIKSYKPGGELPRPAAGVAAAYSGSVDYKHRGSWYTPPGPKLPEGTEIDYLPPAEAIGYVR